MLFEDRLADCADGPLEALPYRSIPDLGSPDGIEEANQLLEPFRSAIKELLHH
ncbi:hypothetical protein ACWD6R_01485 [Streptomyces sp. NPDC005151]